MDLWTTGTGTPPITIEPLQSAPVVLGEIVNLTAGSTVQPRFRGINRGSRCFRRSPVPRRLEAAKA